MIFLQCIDTKKWFNRSFQNYRHLQHCSASDLRLARPLCSLFFLQYLMKLLALKKKKTNRSETDAPSTNQPVCSGQCKRSEHQ